MRIRTPEQYARMRARIAFPTTEQRSAMAKWEWKRKHAVQRAERKFRATEQRKANANNRRLSRSALNQRIHDSERDCPYQLRQLEQALEHAQWAMCAIPALSQRNTETQGGMLAFDVPKSPRWLLRIAEAALKERHDTDLASALRAFKHAVGFPTQPTHRVRQSRGVLTRRDNALLACIRTNTPFEVTTTQLQAYATAARFPTPQSVACSLRRILPTLLASGITHAKRKNIHSFDLTPDVV